MTRESESGLPVEPVQMENAVLPGALKPYKVLLMTYEGMKPPTAEDSAVLATWVKGGGVLVFVDDDKDPFNQVRAWWNTAPNHYATPREAFFAQLGLAEGAAPGPHGAALSETRLQKRGQTKQAKYSSG